MDNFDFRLITTGTGPRNADEHRVLNCSYLRDTVEQYSSFCRADGPPLSYFGHSSEENYVSEHTVLNESLSQ